VPSSEVWLPLVLALLGIGGTLASAQLTQKRADRREAARAELETARETVRHAREDSARLFDHRRAAYLDFLSKIGADLNAWIDRENFGGPPPPEDALVDLWTRLTTVNVYGTPEAARIAEAMYDWLSAEMFGNKAEDHEGAYIRLSAAFVKQIRRDLGVDPSQAGELDSGGDARVQHDHSSRPDSAAFQALGGA
jgi:hypothetical protein